MARGTFPRRQAHHEQTAAEILEKHAKSCGRPITLPVPIELIIDDTFGLAIVYDEIAEPADTIILGALSPSQRRITINSIHEDLLANVMGPERFTLGHELAHWIYDADDPNQGSFDFVAETASDEFCYHRDSPHLPDQLRIREVNANKLAAALLLPAALMRKTDIEAVLGDPRGFAADSGVSQQTLAIRLDDLRLVDRGRAARLRLEWV